MRLSHWLKSIMTLSEQYDCDISGVINDNREVVVGDCFIALSGLTHNGKDYISDAIRRGAVAVLSQAEDGAELSVYAAENNIPVIEIAGLSELLPELLAIFYHEKILLEKIAVTGTNGKSSIAGFVAQLAALNQKPVGIIGTLGRGVWPNIIPSANTTPELSKLLRDFIQMQEQQAQTVVMEVSSHGIAENRIHGLIFDIAVFTNLSRDHLDFHGSMDNYFATKRRLFLSDALKYAVINVDDEYGRRLFIDDGISAEKISYGFSENAQVKITSWTMQSGLLIANIQSPWGEGELVLPLAGKFNITNTLAAICALVLQGYDFTQLLMQASHLRAIDGRMETYLPKQDNQPTVVVDFAHTPDALNNVLQALKQQQASSESKKLGVVFGCGGDRDQGKRAQMGVAADQLADHIWLTADNSRTESTEQIIEQIEQGIDLHIVKKEIDREQAIKQAVEFLGSEDLLLIAGKGHEQYQDIAGVKQSYSDVNVVMSLGYRKAGAQSQVQAQSVGGSL